MRFKKNNNLKVMPGARSSRFVIDLKQELTVAEAKEIKNKNLIVESKLEKLAELDYKKYFDSGKDKARASALNFKNSFLRIIASTLALSSHKPEEAESVNRASPPLQRAGEAGEQVDRANKWFGLINQIFFVSLVKLILVISIKLCYGLGWLAMFILRFIYFALRAVIEPVAQAFIYSLKQLQSFVSKLLYGRVYAWFGSVWSLVKEMKKPQLVYETDNTDDYEAEQINSAEIIEPVAYQTQGIFSYFKPALVFAGVLLILVLPVKAYTYYKTIDNAKGKVLGASESAINNLISGGQAATGLNFNQANKSFTMASDNFLTAQNQLSEINGLLFALASIIPNKNLQLASVSKNIVRAGELSAAVGKNLSLAAAGLLNYQPKDSQAILSNLSTYGRATVANMIGLTNELDQINSDFLPEAYQKDFILLKQKTAELSSGLSEFVDIADKIKIFLGDDTLKRYLLVFQNNSELRASGGFIGSFALVDFSNGEIKNIEVPGGGSYDTEAGMIKKIKSPEPLRLISPDWHFWDANWWPDWPTSAKKLAWFYENSDGPTVDGVIGITPTVMEKILKVIGPIDLKEKYGVIIDADNFWQVTQEFSEQKPNITNQPKKIIGDLMNKIIKELPLRLNKDNFIGFLKAVEESLADKNILFYFTDNALEAKALELGWDGGIKETAGDYLSVINTNIAGGKSDRKIKQEIIHQTQIQADGTIIDNLTIRRTHEGIKREPFSGVRNVDWLRVYVPLGSKLISAVGFKPVDKIFFKVADEGWQDDPDVARAEANATTDQASATKIYNEFNKTVFANWSQVDPGETIEINLKYQLPFKLVNQTTEIDQSLAGQLIAKASAVINPEQKNLYSYSLLMQKQPGMNSSMIESELKLSDNFKPIWQFPVDSSQNKNGWLIKENFNQDKVMAVMMEEK